MSQPLSIELRHCAKTWPGGIRALQPTDLRIAGGELLALLGPSGCGKTTLLRLICGLETPDPGSAILFDGVDVSRVPVQDRGVGVVFQNYALFPNMTVLENVAYGLKVRGVRKPARLRRASDMLDRVRLQEHAGRFIHQLSGGQRQRVALARALAIEPRVLLLDEPLAALDAKLREHVRAELAQMLPGLGITTVIVTHDQDEAMMLGNRIAVMSAGHMEQVGSAETLYRNPSTEFVARFLGTLCSVRAGHHAGLLVPGDQVLHMRPHHIELVDPQQGALQATVVSRHFLGERIRLELNLADGQRLTASAEGSCRHCAGDAVSLYVSPATLQTNPIFV